MTGPTSPALAVRALRKTYGGVAALAGVDLTVARGEVHGVIGQNGCGKSTLIKSLTGVVTPDDGRIELFGRTLHTPVVEPHRHGVAVIHQDIGLVDSLPVLDNVGVGVGYSTGLLRPVPVPEERRIQEDLVARLHLDLDLDAPVGALSPAQRALVGVLRALRLMDGRDGDQLLVLDEPTVALSRAEAATLLSLMRRVADLGSAVVFVSHRLTEVLDVCDTVTVLRSGRRVTTVPAATSTRPDLVEHMLGRRLEEFFPAPPPSADDAADRLVVDGLRGTRVVDVSLVARGGEVLGVTGLAGMGQDELPDLLSGSRSPAGGQYHVDGRRRSFRSPAEAIAAGVALVPGNRLRDGIWPAGTVEENVTLPAMKDVCSPLLLRRGRLTALARRLVDRLRVHPRRLDVQLAMLSGGNQQKVVFAKWLQLGPGVLLLDEPTQGVDAGATLDLLGSAMDLAGRGSTVVVFSGDHELLAAVCHRVVVLHHGRVVRELTGPGLDERTLLDACEAGAPGGSATGAGGPR